MTVIRFVFLLPVLCLGLLAQSTPAPTPPPGWVVSEASYPLPPDLHSKIRDLQHLDDQLEIANQKLELQIQQNRVRQKETVDSIKAIAFRFAQEQKIDLDLYELKPAEITFKKKAGK